MKHVSLLPSPHPHPFRWVPCLCLHYNWRYSFVQEVFPGPCTLFLYLRKFFLCPCISILCPWTLFLCFHISTLCPCRLFLYQANYSYRNTCAHKLYALVQIIPMPVHIIPMPLHIIYMPLHIIYMPLHIIPMPVHIIATPVPNCTGTGEWHPTSVIPNSPTAPSPCASH